MIIKPPRFGPKYSDPYYKHYSGEGVSNQGSRLGLGVGPRACFEGQGIWSPSEVWVPSKAHYQKIYKLNSNTLSPKT